jgi:hypothetical protein
MTRDVMRVMGKCGETTHVWQSEGGRACPSEVCACGTGSQTVYRCSACGEYDFGEPGGPAWFECNGGLAL